MAQQPIGGDHIDLANIQGDILLGGFPKKAEVFWFFRIDEAKVKQFQVNLKKILPFITTCQGTKEKRDEIKDHKLRKKAGMVPISLVSIAFSPHGLNKICKSIGVSSDFKDKVFNSGMRDDAPKLGDNISDWNRGFVENEIDGVILIAGDNAFRIASELGIIKHILEADKASGPVHEVFTLNGKTRGGDQDGHEHFGFKDGVSLPFVDGVGQTKLEGQTVIDAGRLLIGHKNDNEFPTNQPKNDRPDWSKDGSIMVFRKLDQLVPEFQKFLDDNAKRVDNPKAPKTKGSELLGACMVGRWRSGAPIQMTPFEDDPVLAANEHRNNAFDFKDDASLCPLSAHIRKTNPRHDSTPDNDAARHAIMRRGIPFGDDPTPHETQSHVSDPAHPRGLLFVCYQSNLSNGFHFMQTLWANNPGFKQDGVGFDPIIGQPPPNTKPAEFNAAGLDRKEPDEKFALARWVISRGGEYFFTPSISTLRDRFGLDHV